MELVKLKKMALDPDFTETEKEELLAVQKDIKMTKKIYWWETLEKRRLLGWNTHMGPGSESISHASTGRTNEMKSKISVISTGSLAGRNVQRFEWLRRAEVRVLQTPSNYNTVGGGCLCPLHVSLPLLHLYTRFCGSLL